MKAHVRVALAATCLVTLSSAAEAKVHITVDLSKQMMHVESANETFDWKVSSGKFGYETPDGTYGVLWMDRDHKSKEYDNAPMPDAIFFRPGYAIHGAYSSDFGHPASHGCVRLPVAKAALLFDLVKAEGAEVRIIGESPTTIEARSRRPREEDADAYAPSAYATGYGAPYDYPREYQGPDGAVATYATPAPPYPGSDPDSLY